MKNKMDSSKSARQRKLIQSRNEDRPKVRRSTTGARPKQSGLKFSFFCLILCVVVLVIFLGMYTDSFHPIVDGIAVQLGYKQKQFAAIIDAGSTGSRVLAYEFHRGYLDGRLVLDREIFKEVKPGLSSFADSPSDGVKTIQLLLDEAKHFIPTELWGTTPLVLKATAGLRLLDPAKADNLLNSVREAFAKSGFQIPENAVEIMDGTDEGIFSWFTVNFLMGRLSGRNTVAALDLGGGSTQVTFVPKNPSPSFTDYMHSVPTMSGKIDVFTHSYLGLGLMAVRHAVFLNDYPKNQTNIKSECVNSIAQNKKWQYGNVEYTIGGKEYSKSPVGNPVVDLEACTENIKKNVLPLVQPKPITLKQSPISAFSYYFDRAAETGLIDPKEGGEIAVGDFGKIAAEICATANTDQPFMCLDITYLSVLLENGFGLNSQTKLKIYKKIDGHEISWALGCAYNLLTNKV